MKKKTIKTLSTLVIILLLCVCIYLVFRLYEANNQIENLKTNSTQTNTQVATPIDENKQTNNDNIKVFADGQRGVTISFVSYNSADGTKEQHAIITLETKYSVEYMYGEYYESEGNTYIYLKEDIGELRLNGIDGIELSKNTNGGTNIKIKIDNDTLKIGNGTLNKI